MKKRERMGVFQQARQKILLIMKLTTVFLLMTFLSVSATTLAQQATIKVNNASLKSVFKEIRQKMGYTFVFNEQVVNKVGTISMNISSDDVKQILDKCLEGTCLGYRVQGDVIVILTKAELVTRETKKESFKISGKVVDKKGELLPGVTVLIRGTRIGTSTDKNGSFLLEVPRMDSVVLVFSFVGMRNDTLVIRKLTAEMMPLKVVLEEDKEELLEVVVTGMFNRRKEGFTGSAITVTGDELKKMSTTNIAKALATVDPSFRIMDDILNGSNPNRLPDLRMRGQATLPGGGNGGTSTDIVTLQGEYNTYPNQPLLIMDGFEISLQTMVDLDPDRVASITLLKDAAATAIYGSRAANGVIVISTKLPMEGRLWVSYGGNVRVETPDLSDYNLMNAKEKLEVERLADIYNMSQVESAESYQSKLREVKRGVNTYWLDKPLRTAVQQRHTLTFEGGDRTLRYKLYFGFNNTPGVMKDSKRNTLTGALDLQYRFNKILLMNSVMVDNSLGDESPWGDFSEYTKLNPYLRPYDENGNITKRLDQFSGQFRGILGRPLSYLNPMYNTTFNTRNRTTNFGVREQFKVEYNPTEDVRLEGSFSLSKSNGKMDVFRPAQHTAFDQVKDPLLRGDFRRTQREDLAYVVDLTASYNKLLGGVHYVTANVRASLQESQGSSYGAYVTGFPNDNMDDMLFGKKYNEKMTGTENTTRSINGIGSFGYSYNYKYSVDFNISINGSSQFGKDNRFAPFWSAGLRWDVKKERFMAGVHFLSDLVLRGSYGVTGTQGFAPYQSRELYSYSNLLKPYISSDGTGVEIVAMPNNGLKWQETGTWNGALELGLFDGRVTARAEYFYKLTKNSLSQITLAPSLGFDTFPENMGEIENKGVEFNLAFIPYRDAAKSAYWTITVNGSHNTDKLKKISGALKHMNEVNASGMTDSPLPRYEEGESMNRIWVVKSLGIDPLSGEEVFMKRNGEMTGVYDVVDLLPYGNTEPKWQGNINSSFTYKNFGVNVNFAYHFGGQIYNQTLVDKVENADLMYNADKRVLKLRWSQVGDQARFKSISNAEGGSMTKASSRFIMDENTFRMGTLSFSYRMDQTHGGYIKKLGLTSVKMVFNMEDLFYISSVKRERGLSYPFARQFSFSLNLLF